MSGKNKNSPKYLKHLVMPNTNFNSNANDGSNDQAKALFDILNKISQDPAKMDVLKQMLIPLEVDKKSNSNLEDNNRQLNNLSLEEEAIYLDKLQRITSKIEINEVMMRLLPKLYLKNPIYEIVENEGGVERWKCILQVNYGGKSKFEAIGINNNKKKAKKLATEQIILCLLNSKLYESKVKNYLDDLLIKEKIDLNVSNVSKLSNQSCDNGNNQTIIHDNRASNSNISIKEVKQVEENKLNFQIKEIKHSEEKKPHISIEKVLKLNKLNKKEEILDFVSVNNINEKTILNFEIFFTKWERYVVIESQNIILNNIQESIKLNLIKMYKKELNTNKISIKAVGSYNNLTIRSNFTQIDMIVEYSDNLNRDGIVDKSFNSLCNMAELHEQEFKFALIKISNDIYDCKDDKFIYAFNKDRSITFNIYFHSSLSNHIKYITSHNKWFNDIKPDLSLEDYILIKYFKTWRRGKNLHQLKSEAFEFFVYKSSKGSLCEKALRVLNYISEECLNLSSKKYEFANDYQIQFMKNISEENLNMITNECIKAVENIKEENFKELF